MQQRSLAPIRSRHAIHSCHATPSTSATSPARRDSGVSALCPYPLPPPRQVQRASPYPTAPQPNPSRPTVPDLALQVPHHDLGRRQLHATLRGGSRALEGKGLACSWHQEFSNRNRGPPGVPFWLALCYPPAGTTRATPPAGRRSAGCSGCWPASGEGECIESEASRSPRGSIQYQ